MSDDSNTMRLRISSVVESAIYPALKLLPQNMGTSQAIAMMVAIGLQESRLAARAQILDGGGKGPARGLWQFEQGTRESRGGVWGVYLHRSSAEPLRLLCRALDVNYDPRSIWAELEHNDILAAGVARLLLWTDPGKLPQIGKAQDAWDCYVRTWRPGKPKPESWVRLYGLAIENLSETLDHIQTTEGELKNG